MFGIGSFNPFNMVSQIALGIASGGMSLIASFALQIASAMAQQLISSLGQALGLPQSATDAALRAFSEASGLPLDGNLAAATGAAAQQFGGSPVDQARFTNNVNDQFNRLVTTAGRAAAEAEEAGRSNGSRGGGGESFLVALAKALGKVLDEKMTKMKNLAEEMNQVGNSDQAQLGSLSGELNAVGQEVNILSNALKSTIETLGRAQGELARKQ